MQAAGYGALKRTPRQGSAGGRWLELRMRQVTESNDKAIAELQTYSEQMETVRAPPRRCRFALGAACPMRNARQARAAHGVQAMQAAHRHKMRRTRSREMRSDALLRRTVLRSGRRGGRESRAAREGAEAYALRAAAPRQEGITLNPKQCAPLVPNHRPYPVLRAPSPPTAVSSRPSAPRRTWCCVTT